MKLRIPTSKHRRNQDQHQCRVYVSYLEI